MTAAVHGDTSRNYNRIMNQNAVTLYQQNQASASILPHYHTAHNQHYLSALQKSTPLRSSAVTLPESQTYLQQVLPKIGHHSLRQSRHGCENSRQIRRKSAVELLAESKHFYVKSETVLDRKQQLNHRLANHPGRGCSSATSMESNSMSCLISPSRVFPHQRTPVLSARRDTSSNTNLLQLKLRRLLNDSNKETVSSPEPLSCDHFMLGSPKKSYGYKSPERSASISNQNRGILSSPKRLNQKLSIYQDCDASTNDSVFFPNSFLSSQSLPPQHILSDEDLYTYNCCDNTAILTDNYQAISPPAEYAEGSTSISFKKQNRREYASYRPSNYKRSYSQSKSVDIEDPDYSSPTYNVNSHKSLPDLHSQASRHSSNSEAMSYCSRGNRSNKSNSSINRDSGGSSGHYTHRSEPCWKQQGLKTPQQSEVSTAPMPEYRRDSGSSTQHSDNSYRAYGMPPAARFDCIDCRSKFHGDTDSLLDFPTPEVPEAFKDDYTGNEFNLKTYFNLPQSDVPWTPRKSSINKLGCTNTAENVIPADKDLSPPLGTFKRQKCLRFKPRSGRLSSASPTDRDTHIGAECTSDSYSDRKPILRSKSDISDRRWNRNNQPSTDRYVSKDKQRLNPENLSELERFFDNMGLSDDTYELCIIDSASNRYSPVIFSDVSTIDSNVLSDSTETNVATQPYRSIDTVSIIERNARIIKWLCNCRKSYVAL